MDCQPAMVLRRSGKVSRTSVVCTGQAGASVRLLELVSWYGRDERHPARHHRQRHQPRLRSGSGWLCEAMCAV